MPYVEFVLHLEAKALERLEFADTILLAFSDSDSVKMLKARLHAIANA